MAVLVGVCSVKKYVWNFSKVSWEAINRFQNAFDKFPPLLFLIVSHPTLSRWANPFEGISMFFLNSQTWMNVVSTRVQGICISYIHHYSRFHKQTPSYPLVLKHSYGKSPFLIGKSTINEPFSLCLPGKSSQNVPSSPVLRFLIAGARRQLHPGDHGEVSVCIGTMWGSLW